MLARRAAGHGQRAAFSFGRRTWTYLELEEGSNRVANALKGLGVTRGDRVALALTNTPEFVFAYLGTVKLGAAAVLLDTKFKYPEISTLLKHARPKVLFAENPSLGMVAPHRDRFAPMLVVACGDDAPRDGISYESLIAKASAAPIKTTLAAADIADIHYTSGPAFRPMGVMLSHRAVIQAIKNSAQGFHLTPDDVMVLFALPLHHIYGLTIHLLTAFWGGARIVIQQGLSLSSLWETIEHERVTIFLCVPYIFALAAGTGEKDGVKERDLSSLRLCVSGGASLPDSVKHQFETLFGHELQQLYGLTESTAHLTLSPPDGSGTTGSAGRVLQGWQVKVIDGAGGERATGETGEFIIRGPIMDGYYKDPESTAAVIRDGWLHTGDIGYLNDAGEVFILGISKDIFIVKGQNVCPEDIEAVLETYPNISEAATYSVPDEIRGERVQALVTLQNASKVTEAELLQHCRKYLANYKVPKSIGVIAFLPRDSDGNINRESLRHL